MKELFGLLETDRHTTELEKVEGCNDSDLSNVIFVDWDLVISTHKINFEDGFASKIRCKVLDVREQIPFRGGGVVESSVVSTWAPLTVFLHDHMRRLSPGT